MRKLLLSICLWCSVSAFATGGRGGGGRGSGEGAHFGNEGTRIGGSFRAGDGITYHRPSESLPSVVTANEEGGKIAGHDYDADGVDLTERASHPNEYAVTSQGHFVGWQSAADAQASQAAAYRAGSIRAAAVLVGLGILAVVVAVVVF